MQLKQIARDALLKPLQAVSGIVERRHTLPILANVLLEQREGSLYVTATDLEMQITAHSELPGKEGQATTVGARKLQDLLRALPDESTLNVDANRVRFRFANVELVSKVVDGKFPDFNRVIPVGHSKQVELDRLELLAALQRAAILSNEKFRGVRVVLAADQLKIICTNSEQ